MDPVCSLKIVFRASWFCTLRSNIKTTIMEEYMQEMRFDIISGLTVKRFIAYDDVFAEIFKGIKSCLQVKNN